MRKMHKEKRKEKRKEMREREVGANERG